MEPEKSQNKSYTVFRYFFACLLPIMLSIALIMAMLYKARVSEHEADLLKEELHHVEYLRNNIDRELEGISIDLLAKSMHTELSRYLSTGKEEQLYSYAEELLFFLAINGNYDQARFIDKRGMERVRINYNDGNPLIVSPEQLQDKSNRYYFKEAIKINYGHIYVSPLDLNVENGEIEKPYKPIIRFAMPIFSASGEKEGIVILNYKAKRLLKSLYSSALNDLQHPLLINQNGYYLSGPSPEDEFGFMFETKKDITFKRDFPKVWKEINSREKGQIISEEGIFTFKTIYPARDDIIRLSLSYFTNVSKKRESRRFWKVVSHIPEKTIMAKTDRLAMNLLIIYGLISTFAAVACWLIATGSYRKKESARKIEESRMLLSSILNAVPFRISWKDKNLKYIGCNILFAKDAGLKMAEDITGKSDFDIAWIKESEYYREDELKIIKSGESKINFEECRTTLSGEEIYLETSRIPLRSIKGEINGVIGIYKDITEHKKRLVQAERLKDTLIVLSQIGFENMDYNLALITEQAAQAINAKRMSVWLFNDDRSEMLCRDLFIRETGLHEKGNLLRAKDFPIYFDSLMNNETIRADDAETYPCTREFTEIYLRPLGITSMLDVPLWQDGRTRGVICCEHVGEKRVWKDEEADFLSNISLIVAQILEAGELKRIEEERLRVIEDLDFANKELKDFAYIVSHDLKAPLRAIGSLTSWLWEDYGDKLGDEGKEQLDLLSGRVKRMNALIDGILSYSRAGKINEDKSVVDLNDIISEVIETIVPPEGITVLIKDRLPEINCEKTRIFQVFQNLVSNGVKYMDKPDGEIKIGYNEVDGNMIFSVSDNGPGIEEKYFEKIFTIFQTLNPRDDVEGTGVGLSLVKKIVEMYDGKVWIESEPGKGSTFYFSLPISMLT